MTDEELVICNECGKEFPADELVMGKSNDDHTIDDWVCPRCGSTDYDFTDPEEW